MPSVITQGSRTKRNLKQCSACSAYGVCTHRVFIYCVFAFLRSTFLVLLVTQRQPFWLVCFPSSTAMSAVAQSETYEKALVPPSWEYATDGLPNNTCWRPLPQLQLERVLRQEEKIWHGDVRQGNFQCYHRYSVQTEFEVWKSASGLRMLLRKAPRSSVVLQITARVQGGVLRVYGSSFGGNLVHMSTWSLQSKLVTRHVTIAAEQQLRLENLLHSTQDIKFVANGRVLEGTSVIYRPQTIKRLYQMKRLRLRRKTDLRYRAILL